MFVIGTRRLLREILYHFVDSTSHIHHFAATQCIRWQHLGRNSGKGCFNGLYGCPKSALSNANPELPGLYVEVAHLLAEELGVKLELHWLNTLRDSLLADMIRGHCDCVIGVPIEERAMSESIQLGKRVDFSKPFYGTGYVLVKQKNNQQSPKKLEDIKSEAIGTEAGSIASDVLRQMGYNRHVYRSQIDVLNALQDGKIAYACVWANIGWLIEKGSRIQQAEQTSTVYPELEIVEGYVPEARLRWNVAIAFSKDTPTRKNTRTSRCR